MYTFSMSTYELYVALRDSRLVGRVVYETVPLAGLTHVTPYHTYALVSSCSWS